MLFITFRVEGLGGLLLRLLLRRRVFFFFFFSTFAFSSTTADFLLFFGEGDRLGLPRTFFLFTLFAFFSKTIITSLDFEWPGSSAFNLRFLSDFFLVFSGLMLRLLFFLFLSLD